MTDLMTDKPDEPDVYLLMTKKELGAILDVTEDMSFAEPMKEKIKFAKKRIKLINKIKERGILIFGLGSKAMIGNAEERFKMLEYKKWDWSSFYNGWLEGRADMYSEIHKKLGGKK